VTWNSGTCGSTNSGGWTFYQAYLDALDRYDTDQFATFLADDVSVQFNNEEAMTGRQAAIQGLGGFWASIKSILYAQEPGSRRD
jgi:hypothetical protein